MIKKRDFIIYLSCNGLRGKSRENLGDFSFPLRLWSLALDIQMFVPFFAFTCIPTSTHIKALMIA